MKNIPNILSAIRICLVPVFVIAYFTSKNDINFAAAGIYALAAATDVLDGYLARRNNWITDLGRILDPLGDKLMTFAVISCITISGRFPVFVLVLFVAKELCMMAGGIIIHNKYKLEMPPSNRLGKASTALFFVVCATVLLFPSLKRSVTSAMVTLAIAVAFAALGSYIMTFMAVSKNKDGAENK